MNLSDPRRNMTLIKKSESGLLFNLKYETSAAENLQLPKQASLIVQSISAATITAYSFYHLFWGETLVAVFAFLSSACAICSIRETVADRPNLLCCMVFSVFAGLTLVSTSYYFGYRGLIFLFPYITALVFIFAPRLAASLGCFVSLICLVAATNSMPLEQVVRYTFPLLITVALTMGYAAKMLQQQQALWREANRDWLTGIMSRKRFTERFTAFLDKRRDEAGRFAMIFIDLDNFKQVNDQHGHAAGDHVLREVALRLEAESINLSSDNVCDTDELPVVRLSGDEFALMICCAGDEASVMAIANRVACALHGTYEWPGKQISLGVSIGVFIGDYRHETTESALAKADAAMYFSKRDHASHGIRLYDSEVARYMQASSENTSESSSDSDAKQNERRSDARNLRRSLPQ